MRVLVIDNVGGCGQLSFIMRAQDAGHDVRWFYRKPTDRNAQPIGRGIVTVVPDWRDWMRWADLVILGDNTRYLTEMDVWRRDRGTRIIGATQQSAKWELDRTFGQQVFKKAGIPVPPYREFHNYDDAIRYVEKEGRAFVSKPCGDVEDKNLSYVADSPADLIYMLKRWKKASKHKDSFILQERIKGCEMAVGGWFGPEGFNAGWLENFEEKKLFAGGLGPNTGEMGTTMRVVRRSKLADKVLKPLEGAIERTSHTGYVDVNCIVDDDGEPWPLEFTMRFGYPTWPIQMHLLTSDPVEWLMDLAEGRDAKPFEMDKTAVGVLMAGGDFPHSHITKKDVVGVPIYGCSPGVLDRVSFLEVMIGEAPHDVGDRVVTKSGYQTAGDYILVAVGVADDIMGARDRAYRTLGRLKLPSSPFWRDDIGQRLSRALPVLQERGFALGWSYAPLADS